MSRKTLTDRFRQLIGIETKAGLAEPDAWLSDLFGATPSAAGISVSPRTAVKAAPVRAAIAAISEPLGTLPVHVYKRTAAGKERAPNHPLYRLLHDQANDFTSASRFRELMTADALLHNGGFAFIARNSERAPVSLHRLDPCEYPVSVKNDPFEGPAYEIQQDGKTRQIPRENILHLPSPSLSGHGLVHDARDVIGLALVLERHASKLFANNARPSGVLSIKGAASAEALAKVKTAWLAAHGGDKSGGTAVIPSDAEWRALTMTSVDSQFAEMRRFSIEEIARFFNISPIFLQDLGRATWSNSEQAKDNLLSVTLLPWITKWEGEIALKLFNADERTTFFAEFMTEGFVRADYAAKTEGISKLIAARVLNPNEARAMMNLPAYAGGDQFINPNTTSPDRIAS
ncbi:phage portal protein [Bradyrhizobium sp. AZCC 1699]|uniref:phage portal protein n=1 Tax=Bradyrhizobium sp. AZCC 1699 TaxID=3117024 RepID=UPI002FF0D858